MCKTVSNSPFIRLLRQELLSYQRRLIKMRAKTDNINHCAVPLLSRAAVNLCWYYSSILFINSFVNPEYRYLSNYGAATKITV